MEQTIDISEVIDKSKVGAFQVGVFILCGLCLIMDGFDVQAMGYVAPALIRDWKITSAALTPAFTAALTGILVGSLLCSMIADKLGRRPVLVFITLAFSLLTLLTGQANSIVQLVTLRFLAGVALGGIMPNAMTLVGEYTPGRLRVLMMIVVSNGFNLGAVLGGLLSVSLIPAFGWPAIFYVGGAIPFVIALLMFFSLPESLQFLTLRGKSPEKIAKWVKRVDRTVQVDSGTRYVVQEQKSRGVPIMKLFGEGRAVGTLLLWTLNFMNLLNLYFLSSWLPTVFRDSGYSLSNALYIGTTLQLGGTIGTFVLGGLIGRLGFIPVLTTSFAIASVSIALIGQPMLSIALLFVIVFAAGLTVVGGQGAVNALAGTYYPTDLRSTGIGSGLGIGRVGSIVGPTVAGILIGNGWAARELFYAATVPAIISVVVMFSLRWVMKPKLPAVARTQVLAH
jgi:AAHS family 4-hydroxybenzoate transporter-like MFS transporter